MLCGSAGICNVVNHSAPMLTSCEMTLLQKMERQRLADRERLRNETRQQLNEVLCRTISDQRVFLFGSLLKAGKFSDESDIDIALESEPQGLTLYQLIALLGERMGRTVDVVLLDECRFREKILREGELWTPRD